MQKCYGRPWYVKENSAKERHRRQIIKDYFKDLYLKAKLQTNAFNPLQGKYIQCSCLFSWKMEYLQNRWWFVNGILWQCVLGGKYLDRCIVDDDALLFRVCVRAAIFACRKCRMCCCGRLCFVFHCKKYMLDVSIGLIEQ